MDWDVALRAGSTLFTVGIGIYTLLSNRQKASAAEARALDNRLNAQETRIVTLEQQILHLPDAHQLAELAGDMKAIKAELAGLARELAPLTRSVDRINDYLLTARQ